RRSGRVNALQAFAGTTLGLQPVFRFRRGAASGVARPRTRERALAHVVEASLAEIRGRPVHLAAFHAAAPREAEALPEAIAATAWLPATGVAVVAGHAFPLYRRAMAGRGVAAAAGVFLVVLPVEMAIAGALIVAGLVLRTTSLGTTVGLASVPAVAAARGQPGPFIALALALFALIVGRRLEGVGVVVRAGVSPAQALWYRVGFDSSGPPGHGTSGSA